MKKIVIAILLAALILFGASWGLNGIAAANAQKEHHHSDHDPAHPIREAAGSQKTPGIFSQYQQPQPQQQGDRTAKQSSKGKICSLK